MNARNPNTAANRRLMRGVNVSTIDQVPQWKLDQLLWKAIHGDGSKPPPPGPNAVRASRGPNAVREKRGDPDG